MFLLRLLRPLTHPFRPSFWRAAAARIRAVGERIRAKALVLKGPLGSFRIRATRVLLRIFYPFFDAACVIFKIPRSGSLCLVQRQGRYLLVRQTYGRGNWTLPGGGRKRNENAHDAAIREVLEETGLAVARAFDLGEEANRYPADRVHYFFAESPEGAVIPDPVEIKEARWFSRGAIPLSANPAVFRAAEMKEHFEGAATLDLARLSVEQAREER